MHPVFSKSRLKAAPFQGATIRIGLRDLKVGRKKEARDQFAAACDRRGRFPCGAGIGFLCHGPGMKPEARRVFDRSARQVIRSPESPRSRLPKP